MKGCVLYLPFYSYGANAQKIWDMSGQGNHGVITGAVPANIPMLSPINKVTNGTFDGDTGWTKGTGWAITTLATKTAGVASDLEQDILAVAGEEYRLIYTIARTAGIVTPQIGGVDGTARSAAGTYEDIIRATGTGNLKFQADASFAGTVDNVETNKIIGYESLGWSFNGSTNIITVTDFLDTGNSALEITVLIWCIPVGRMEQWPYSLITMQPIKESG